MCGRTHYPLGAHCYALSADAVCIGFLRAGRGLSSALICVQVGASAPVCGSELFVRGRGVADLASVARVVSLALEFVGPVRLSDVEYHLPDPIGCVEAVVGVGDL